MQTVTLEESLIKLTLFVFVLQLNKTINQQLELINDLLIYILNIVSIFDLILYRK
jgi:hypothetical protein